mmetsp:Transcript_58296/g.185807  ORF Transcript_58296/g.185807 Transcript_58296/m.185807 type:complete len:255 (-) Transcript_58296:477-1241(-)
MEVVEASEAPTMIQEKMCVVHEHPPEPPPETPEQKPTQSHASDDDHSDDGVSLLPRHTKVLVTGNNRTKSSLVGLRGVVKKAVGLGGWHWLVLSNGDEVRLQRNALSVLEQPTGEEEDDDEDEDEDNRRHGASSPEHHDSEMTLARSRPKRPRPCPAPVVTSGSIGDAVAMRRASDRKRAEAAAAVGNTHVNFNKLETAALKRYRKHYKLDEVSPNSSKDQLVAAVVSHFHEQEVEETNVINLFISMASRAHQL